MIYNPGDVLIDRYQIDELLGEGPFSDAFRVTDTNKAASRTLKVLRASLPGLSGNSLNELAIRYQMELSLNKQLNVGNVSTNIIQVFAAPSIGGIPAIEREYAPRGNLQGYYLQHRVSGKLMPISRVIKLGLDVAEGLSILHTHQIVHRDLKPANILIDIYGTAKISDLYLAQAPSIPGLSSTSHSFPFKGPTGFASPEQGHDRQKLTPASDIYSLGLILFEILSGYAYQRLETGVHLAQVRPEVPSWLDDLVSRMLSKDPEKRPYDGATIAALLRAGMDSVPPANQTSFNLPVEFEERPVLYGIPVKTEPEVKPSPSYVENDLTEKITIAPATTAPTQQSVWQTLLELFRQLSKNPAYILLSLVMLIIIAWVVFQLFFK